MKRRIVSFLMAAALTFTSMPVDHLAVWASEPVQEDLGEAALMASEESIVPGSSIVPEEDAGMEIVAEDPAVSDVDAFLTSDDLITDEAVQGTPEEDAFLEDGDSAGEDTPEEAVEVLEAEDSEDLQEEFEILEEDMEETEEQELLEAVSDEELYASGDAEEDEAILAEALDNKLVPDADPVVITYNSDKWIHYYSFAPTETSEITISSEVTSGSLDTVLRLYELSQEEVEAESFTMPGAVAYSDDDGDERQFKLTYIFEPGYTYIFEICPYSKQSAPTDTTVTNVSFEKTKALTGVSVATQEISAMTGSDAFADLELDLVYDDGAKTETVKAQYVGGYDGYNCIFGSSSYGEQIIIRAYLDGEQVSLPVEEEILEEVVYTLEPCVMKDGELVAFDESTLTVTMPEFEPLTVGQDVALTLEEGDYAYYKIAADKKQYVSLWVEEEDYYDIHFLEFRKDSDGKMTRSDSGYISCGSSYGRKYKLEEGDEVY